MIRPPPTRDSPVFGGKAAENGDSPNVTTGFSYTLLEPVPKLERRQAGKPVLRVSG